MHIRSIFLSLNVMCKKFFETCVFYAYFFKIVKSRLNLCEFMEESIYHFPKLTHWKDGLFLELTQVQTLKKRSYFSDFFLCLSTQLFRNVKKTIFENFHCAIITLKTQFNVFQNDLNTETPNNDIILFCYSWNIIWNDSSYPLT